MKFYLFDEKTGVYQGYKNAVLDKAKTIALKKSVLKYPQPKNSTTIEPTGKIGGCWFVKGGWVNENPIKKAPVVKTSAVKKENKN